MKTITLPNGVWQFDPDCQLGPRGGFGTVYLGYSVEFEEVAVKEIRMEAQRELRIGDELLHKHHQYVIPIYDAGQDSETGKNYLVMARAEKSLQDEIRLYPNMDDIVVVNILHQIVSGLIEVKQLIHRDLKPGNILFHSDAWKIADFGIAKFVEETTSLQTLQDFLSAQYAAPEQWNYVKPTNAVDIYAVGCIAFALLTGAPPFSGSREELKDHHLHSSPPITKINNPQLRTLISMMLRKTPETRPTLERVHDLLAQMRKQERGNSSSGLSSLSFAAAKISENEAIEQAKYAKSKSENEERRTIAHEAQSIMFQNVDTLFKRIILNAPNAIITKGPSYAPKYSFFPNQSIVIGEAELTFIFSRFPLILADDFKRSGWNVFTGIIVQVLQKNGIPYERGANLWFSNLGKGQEYRWWEVSYMSHPLMRSHPIIEPYSVNDLAAADLAAAPGMAEIQFGSKPTLVDDEFVDDFCNRWAELLALAINGELRHPSKLPLD